MYKTTIMKLIILLLLLPLISFSQKLGDFDTSLCALKIIDTATSEWDYVGAYEVHKCTNIIYKNGKPWDWEWTLQYYLYLDKKRIDPKGKRIIYIESMM